jgi:phasin family protein
VTSKPTSRKPRARKAAAPEAVTAAASVDAVRAVETAPAPQAPPIPPLETAPEAPAVAAVPAPVNVAPPAPQSAQGADPVEAPARPRPVLRSVPTTPKEDIMATAFETTQETVKNTVHSINSSTEAALEQGKAAIEQMTVKSREAIETSIKAMDEVADMARGNVEAAIASARAATAGFEQIAAHVTEISKKSFEEMNAATKSMTSAKTPNELLQLQSDFAKAQFDQVVTEMSKMTELMMKITGEIFEPVQNRAAIATDKVKDMFAAK